MPAYWAGAAAGLLVPLVHVAVALAGHGPLQAARGYLPETLAYTVLGTALHLFRVDRRLDSPLQAALLIALADLSANVVEVLVRPDPVQVQRFAVMALVAMGRAAVALGACYVLQEGVRQREWEKERRSYMEKLFFACNLQTEAFFLKKSAREIEQIMAKAHRLYRDLNGQPGQSLALEIAKDIHEVKKDYQRTLSALNRLVDTPKLQAEMDFSEIVALVFDANRSYAAGLGKQVAFKSELLADFRTARYGRWVSILNNLVSNGVEACGTEGTLTVTATRMRERLVVEVSDTGAGIPREDWDLVFSPGFSTKLNPVTGAFSSGIGLTHVAELIGAMGGAIRVAHAAPDRGARFRLEVPWTALEIADEME
ncbi:MAG TPA: ATP-binding protein [Symbiobacteriaceae bacterium]|nr:ATP-binding protein [Symbiobacteriaceae bacterium]